MNEGRPTSATGSSEPEAPPDARAEAAPVAKPSEPPRVAHSGSRDEAALLRFLMDAAAELSSSLELQEVFRILNIQAETRKPFGEIAVELGLLDTSEFEGLLQAQMATRPPIGEVLVQMRLVDPETLESELLAYAAEIDKEKKPPK